MIEYECMLAGFCAGLFFGTATLMIGYVIQIAFSLMRRI